MILSGETKYYAVIGQGRTIENPSGLVRRRPTVDGIVDESIRRDLTWGRTDVFHQIEHGEELGLPELAEISEHDAEELIARFRRRWGGQRSSHADG